MNYSQFESVLNKLGNYGCSTRERRLLSLAPLLKMIPGLYFTFLMSNMFLLSSLLVSLLGIRTEKIHMHFAKMDINIYTLNMCGIHVNTIKILLIIYTVKILTTRINLNIHTNTTKKLRHLIIMMLKHKGKPPNNSTVHSFNATPITISTVTEQVICIVLFISLQTFLDHLPQFEQKKHLHSTV